MTLKDWLSETTPDRREVTVCFDRRLVSELVKAKADLETAQLQTKGMLGGSETNVDLEEHVAKTEAKVAERSHVIVFEGIGWRAWRDLLAKHPPQPDQAEVFQRAVQLAYMPHSIVNLGYDAESFVPAAIHASCTEPGISVAEAKQMLESSPSGVLERMWAAVLEVNLGGGDDPFVRSVSTSSVVVPASAKK